MARFSLVFLIVTWLAMAVTRDAGGSIHHTVLLWPFPHLFIAAVAGAFRWRFVAAVTGVVLVAMNLLVLSQYTLQFERDGADGVFSDAIFPLSKTVAAHADQKLYFLDWGMRDALDFMYWGRLRLIPANSPFMSDDPSAWDRREITGMFSDPNALFVTHVAAREEFKGVRDRFARNAATAGRRQELVETICDSNGRPVFEILQLR
jgi:hypothetical protein